MEYKLKILALIAITIFFVNVKCQEEDFEFELLKLGGYCNATIECDENDYWQECTSLDKCGCKKNGRNDLHPDDLLNKCLAKVGDQCMYSNHETPLACTRNATCYPTNLTEGVCRCLPGYIASPRKEECKVSINGKCDTSYDCQEYGLLVCNHETKKCVCLNENEMIWETDLIGDDELGTSSACRVIYGGTCDTNVEGFAKLCSKSSGLECNNKVCGCMDDYEQYQKACFPTYQANCTDRCHPKYHCKEHSHENSTCQCKPGYEESDDGVSCIALVGSFCYHESEELWSCVQNSQCSETTKKCECVSPYEVGKDGKCYKSYDQVCTTANDECNNDSFFVCTNGRCKCETGFDYYEDDNGQCLGLVGTSCHDQREVICIPWAKCSPGPVESEESCSCEKGFTDNKEKCYPTRDSPCLPENEIDRCNRNEFLECTNDICKCITGFINGEEDEEPCLGLAGTQCKDGDYTATCIANATCMGNGNEAVCTCDEGFSRNYLDNSCYPSFESPCMQEGTFDSGCNEYEFLTCHNNETCICKEGFGYDEISKGCKAKVSTRCYGYLGGQLNATCFDNADCSGEGQLNATCQCLPSFTVDARDDRCYGTHGADCSNDAKCNEFEFLDCNAEEVCDCHADFFKLDDGKCNAKVGKPCKFEDGRNASCVPYSACVAGACSCIQGFTSHPLPTYDGKCYPTNLSPCLPASEGLMRCNSGEFLTCNVTGTENGICLCDEPDDSEFVGKCFGLVDGSCDTTPREGDLRLGCILNATCIANEGRRLEGTCKCGDGFYATEDRKCSGDPPLGDGGAEGMKVSFGVILTMITLYLSISIF